MAVLQQKHSKFGNFRENFISPKALKDIFSILKIHDFSMIYIYQKRTKSFCQFVRVLSSQNSTSAKFPENKTLAKFSEFTVLNITAKCDG